MGVAVCDRGSAAAPAAVLLRWLVGLATVTFLTAGLTGVAAANPARAAVGCQVPSGQAQQFDVDGTMRTYLIRVPDGADSATAMVMSLHGHGGTGDGQQDMTSLGADSGDPTVRPESPESTPAAQSITAMADQEALGVQERFIAVFPEALDGTWDLAPDGSDVRFLAALTAWLHAQGCSSPGATSLNGFSMGAMMAARLLCAAPDLFSGLAMVSGVYPPAPGCQLPASTSVVGLHGTADWLVSWDGWVWPSMVELGMESFPHDRAEMLRMWSQVKGCQGAVRATAFAIAVDDYVGCDGGSVQMVTLVGGDHTWNTYAVQTSRLVWSVLRPQGRHPVHSAAQALMQALPPDPITGVLRAADAGSVIAVDAEAPGATVVGTLTVTGGLGNGFVTAYPCGQSLPVASNVNFTAGESVATGAFVRTDAAGRFCVYVSNGVHVVWDQVAETDLPGHAPLRLTDTRAVTPS